MVIRTASYEVVTLPCKLFGQGLGVLYYLFGVSFKLWRGCLAQSHSYSCCLVVVRSALQSGNDGAVNQSGQIFCFSLNSLKRARWIAIAQNHGATRPAQSLVSSSCNNVGKSNRRRVYPAHHQPGNMGNVCHQPSLV